MDTSDNYEMVSSSLAAVISQSLSASFRNECHLLLGVSSNRDVQDVIYTLLKCNTFKATSGEGIPSSQSDSSDGCGTSQHGLDENQVVLKETDNSNCMKQSPERKSLTKDPDFLQVSTVNKDPNISKINAVPIVQYLKFETEAAESDEESQLDWDTDK